MRHIKNRILAAAAALCAFAAAAQNPICPPGTYIADPTARVGQDGKMYIYGSTDIRPGEYCSRDYHVLSSDNLRDWTMHRSSFSWDETLYAPDVIWRGGTYYLYYDTPDGSEFVASSDSPVGPFRGGEKIEGPSQIDPNIFIDDDGQAYYFWGQFTAKGAKMNPDMKTLDMSTLETSIVTERKHHFHEGSFVFKRGGYYYFVFADISRRGRPTCLGYAMATEPLGPYQYRGVIIDNYGCDPESWNNHGSVVRFGERWYVLYHRSTHGSRSMRKACIEPITFNEDGTINEVEMTSQGAAGPLSAFSAVSAASACGLRGNVRIEGGAIGEELAGIRSGDAAVWKYLDFGTGARKVEMLLMLGEGGRISVRADSPEGKILATLDVPVGKDYVLVSGSMSKLKGVHALWLTFSGPDSAAELFRIVSVTFK